MLPIPRPYKRPPPLALHLLFGKVPFSRDNAVSKPNITSYLKATRLNDAPVYIFISYRPVKPVPPVDGWRLSLTIAVIIPRRRLLRLHAQHAIPPTKRNVVSHAA